MSKKVFVGLSGGVDSATSAALLLERGYDVVGAFIKIWQPEFVECSWEKDRLDAMRVCAALGIPFREIDLSHEYKREIVGDLIEGYKRGETPNPDVLCNRHIKFGSFAQWAFSLGADYVATGHYARIEKRDERYALLRGVDADKDQSYFLWQLTQADLARTLFPVGGMKKEEVRAYAQQIQVPVAKKPDSQGLCFVGDVTMAEFLSRYIPPQRGIVQDERGHTIGTHSGAHLYTLGQRHGFVMDGKNGQRPHYVIAVSVKENTVTVSERKEIAARANAPLRAVSYVFGEASVASKLDVQLRYREVPGRATLQRDGVETHVLFDEPRVAPPGQSAVFYDGEELLGGGIIR
jgi:tRNA-specific 2-thiouridylase